MHENTRALRALLRQDWESFEAFVTTFEREGKGTPVAIVAFAFTIAVRRRFGGRPDMRDIIRFVADARTDLLAGEQLPAREAEALICATLDIEAPGVLETIDGLDVGTIATYEMQLLFKLVTDAGLDHVQIDELLIEAEAQLEDWPQNR